MIAQQILTMQRAKAAGVKSTQLRKDLTYFGQFGTRGLLAPPTEPEVGLRIP